MTERNWQEDMKLSEQAKGWTYEITFNGEGNIVAKDANYTFAQVIAGDVGMSNAEIILDGLEALPYWLQQYAALQREYERFQQVAKGWNDDFQALEAEVDEAKAETARLKKTIEGMQLIRKIEKSTRVQPEHTSFLQDKGDKL